MREWTANPTFPFALGEDQVHICSSQSCSEFVILQTTVSAKLRKPRTIDFHIKKPRPCCTAGACRVVLPFHCSCSRSAIDAEPVERCQQLLRLGYDTFFTFFHLSAEFIEFAVAIVIFVAAMLLLLLLLQGPFPEASSSL
jgi:hypothetical protein